LEPMRLMSSPTLLIFTLGANRESARRPLVPADLRGLEVGFREDCLAVALAAGRASGCRLEVCSPAPIDLPEDACHVLQQGHDFGSRLERAMAEAFERGAGPLVVVGADVPGLSSRHLDEALSLLDGDPERVVIGPSPDGGLYLLAARRPIAGLAGAIRWCRRETLRDLLQALRAAGRPVTLLAPLADLDHPTDLERWLAGSTDDSRWRRPTARLRTALAHLHRPLGRPSPRPRISFVPVLAGRAPPVSFSR
jgi:2-phospho-L-lactate guanylyltransferase (CobY/MobA/RfbA family)